MQGEIENEFLFQEQIYYKLPQVLVSSYDLICFLANRNDIYVCNPRTHQVRLLPCATAHLPHLGFSYLSSSAEYIVVRLFEFRENGVSEFCTGIEVMKFGRNAIFGDFGLSWKRVEKSWHCSIDDGIRVIDEGPMVERTMYWYVHSGPNCVLAFDIDDESLCMVDVPFDLHHDYVSFSVLINLNGRLCVTGIDKKQNTPILKIWGLREREKSSWVVEYIVKFYDLEYGFLKDKNFSFEELYPSCTSDGELVFGAHGTFYFYNIETRCFKEVKKPEGCFKIGFIS